MAGICHGTCHMCLINRHLHYITSIDNCDESCVWTWNDIMLHNCDSYVTVEWLGYKPATFGVWIFSVTRWPSDILFKCNKVTTAAVNKKKQLLKSISFNWVKLKIPNATFTVFVISQFVIAVSEFFIKRCLSFSSQSLEPWLRSTLNKPDDNLINAWVIPSKKFDVVPTSGRRQVNGR